MFKKGLLGLLCGLLVILSGCQSTTDNNPSINTAVNNKPNQKAAAINTDLGIGYLRQGNVQRAKSKLLLAMQQAPGWPPALDAMAYYLETTGENEQAEKYYREAIRIAPNDGASQNNYGTFLCKSGKYNQAIEHFMKAVKDPDYLDNAEAYENAGLCALKIPQNNVAYQYFVKALKLDPRRDTSMLELANLMLKSQRYEEAKHYIDLYMQTAKPDALGLWIGFQVAKHLDNKVDANQYEKMLKEQYPIAYRGFIKGRLG